MINIYVRLIGEGVEVYRPVPAKAVSDSIFLLEGLNIFDPDDENWEFPPGTRVIVEARFLNGESTLVAVSAAPTV